MERIACQQGILSWANLMHERDGFAEGAVTQRWQNYHETSSADIYQLWDSFHPKGIPPTDLWIAQLYRFYQYEQNQIFSAKRKLDPLQLYLSHQSDEEIRRKFTVRVRRTDHGGHHPQRPLIPARFSKIFPSHSCNGTSGIYLPEFKPRNDVAKSPDEESQSLQERSPR
jgi:hypothetical protein